MSDTALLPLMRPVYPERAEKLADNWLDESGERYAGAITRAMRGWRVRHTPMVGRIRKYEKALGKPEIDEIRMKARELGKLLRRDGFTQDLVARSFALVSVAAER